MCSGLSCYAAAAATDEFFGRNGVKIERKRDSDWEE
jgi:hypothetical protein